MSETDGRIAAETTSRLSIQDFYIAALLSLDDDELYECALQARRRRLGLLYYLITGECLPSRDEERRRWDGGESLDDIASGTGRTREDIVRTLIDE